MGVSPVRINEKCTSDGRDARATSEIGSVRQNLIALIAQPASFVRPSQHVS